MAAAPESSRDVVTAEFSLPRLGDAVYWLMSAIVPGAFFGTVLVAKTGALLADISGMARPAGAAAVAADALAIAYRLLVVLFFAIAVLLFVVRRKPVLTTGRVMPRIVALCGAFALTAIAMAPADPVVSARTLLAALLLLAGNTLAALSLLTLGRSFSVMPEARQLITSGPYAIVRHPIYVGEMLAGCGIALQTTSALALPVLLAFMVLQLQRAAYEEDVLQQAFPEYAQYKARTARLIPHIF